MKSTAIIYSLAIVLLTVWWSGCAQSPPRYTDEDKPGVPAEIADRGFDPLEFQRDKQVIPERFPQSGNISGKQALVARDIGQTDIDSAQNRVANRIQPADTLNRQSFRIQIFTSKLYGEAQKARRVATEIFDQPVTVDYEVPYFKVRVGSFATRLAAETYQQQAKAAGYTGAWVVMRNLAVKEAAPLYDDVPEMFYQHQEEVPLDMDSSQAGSGAEDYE